MCANNKLDYCESSVDECFSSKHNSSAQIPFNVFWGISGEPDDGRTILIVDLNGLIDVFLNFFRIIYQWDCVSRHYSKNGCKLWKIPKTEILKKKSRNRCIGALPHLNSLDAFKSLKTK